MKIPINLIFLYLLASVCAICPICIYTRRNPKKELSKKLVALERGCPFCYAYSKIRKKKR
jgi:hypothetical protein